MLIRIVLSRPIGDAEQRFLRFAPAIAALLAPASLIAFTISCWSIADRFHWTTNFFVSTGLFSHWQTWMILAAALLLGARVLTRYAERQERISQHYRSRFS